MALVQFSTDDVVGYGPGVWAAATAMAVVAATTPVVRLVLVSRPSVTAWITNRPPAEPVWSAELQWVLRRSGTVAVVLAVLTPVLILLALTLVVLSTQEERVDYGIPPGIDGDRLPPCGEPR